MRRSSWEWEDARCKLKMCYQKAIINCNHATQPIIIINLVPLLLPRRRPSRSSLHLHELPFPVQPPCQPHGSLDECPVLLLKGLSTLGIGLHREWPEEQQVAAGGKQKGNTCKMTSRSGGQGVIFSARHASASLELCLCISNGKRLLQQCPGKRNQCIRIGPTRLRGETTTRICWLDSIDGRWVLIFPMIPRAE